MGLLTVAMLAAGFCRNLPIPYTVVLVIIGMALGELSRTWSPLAPLHEFQLSPDLVFFIFLPSLIFESGFNLDARQLVKDFAPVLVLAIPALVFSTAFVGIGLWLALDVELIIALLFGALISATDPVAVVALFKELGAPHRLNVLVDGEALLNDATAIVVFTILLGLAVGGGIEWADAGLVMVEFLRVFVGGAVVGALVGFLISELLYRLQSGLNMILAMSIVMAYASFILGEHVLHVSGVMASASAAVTLGVVGVTRMHQEATVAIGEIWEVIALVCNSLLFLLVGLSVDAALSASRIGAIGVAVLLVLAARAASVYTMVPATIRLFSLPRVTMGERHIMWWGGLKGGLAIAIVLSIPEDLPGRQVLLDMTVGVVLFTLLVNAPTIRPLMAKLGMDRFTDDEWAELKHGLLESRKRADRTVGRLQRAEVASTATHHRVARTLEETLGEDIPDLGEEQRLREVYLTALRTEMEELRRLYDLGVITQYTFLDIRNTLQRDREAHSSQTLSPSVGGRKRQSPFVRLEMAMLRRLREEDWAAGLLARYQRIRLAQHLHQNIAGILMCEAVLERLKSRGDFDERQKEVIAKGYEHRLERRKARVRTIREEFPEFYQRFELRLCSRVALNTAMRNAHQEHHHGEIGAKAFNNIKRRIQATLSELPPLSEPLPTLTPKELIDMVPLLSGLSEKSLDELAGRAHPVTFLPGDIVIGEGQKGDALYIITHGEVRVHRKASDGGETTLDRLSDGDFFGEMALLGDQVRTATVEADTPSTLLRLSRRDVLELAVQNPEVKQRLHEVDQARRQQEPLRNRAPPR